MSLFKASGQNPIAEVCKSFSSLQIPASARPTLQQALSAGRNCDTLGLYYSSGIHGHFQKARFCGLAQLGLFSNGVSPARAKAIQNATSGGATEPTDITQDVGMTLAMLFANGDGVTRNALAAKTLVCTSGFSSQQAEPSAMPDLLRSIDAGERIDLCGKDEGPQGRSIWYVCSVMRAGRTLGELAASEKRLERVVPPSQLAALHALESAWKSFAAAQYKSFESICGYGTGCGVFTAQNEFQMETKWLAQLKEIESGQPPVELPTVSDYAAIDKDLNKTYKDMLQDAESTDKSWKPVSGVTQRKSAEELRDAQRCWLRYREAWVQLAALRWPVLPQDRWRAWLTLIRTNELEDSI